MTAQTSENTAKLTFSLVYTSVRPQLIPEVVAKWTERSATFSTDMHEWVISVDAGDTASLQAAEQVAVQLQAPITCKVVVNNGPKTCVAGWNLAAEHSKGQVIIAVADDFEPPMNWDASLLALEPKGWTEGNHVVHVDDGYVRTLCTLAIVTRKRYEQFGYLFYPAYESMFSDTEFGTVAERDGVLIDAMHLLFEHMHPDCGKRQRDNADLAHASTPRWVRGEQLFNFRKAQGFPVDMGPKAVQAPAVETTNKGENFAAYMQVTQDDLCLHEVCLRMLSEGVKDIFWAEPSEYWSGEPLEAAYAAELDAVAEQVLKAGINLRRKKFDVKASRLPGDTRITVETRVRNDSLDWVRSEGFTHILVVDGDELWKPGALEAIKPYVAQGHTAISARMTPVIGLPGWPVGEASDTAVVYMGGNSRFKCCRSPIGRTMAMPSNWLLHFTGTRKTMAETILKHKRSGHYDDPAYLFDVWIKDVLPNIKPGWTYRWPNGLQGLHMYQPYQIWNRVRDWLPDELAAMPESLKPYLGGF